MNQPIKHKWALAGLAARCLSAAREIAKEESRSPSTQEVVRIAVGLAHEILSQCQKVTK